MRKKAVILGGGAGMSVLLRGLKHFPLDITCIVSVADNGKSTGILRQEFNTPAVGDIRRVVAALAETEPLVEQLINYRFNKIEGLSGHPIGNLLLTALCDITGSMADSVEALSKVLNLKGKVLPLTEDYVTLVAKMEDDSIVKGEAEITASNKKIETIYYEQKPVINRDVIKNIEEADLIVLSMGSVYTSIIPNLICDEVLEAIEQNKNKIMYICNLFTQPGETDNFSVGDHIAVLNNYLGNKKIDVIIVNNKHLDDDLCKKYVTLEQKNPVLLDKNNPVFEGIQLIEDDYAVIENGILRHNGIKVGFAIFSYLM